MKTGLKRDRRIDRKRDGKTDRQMSRRRRSREALIREALIWEALIRMRAFGAAVSEWRKL